MSSLTSNNKRIAKNTILLYLRMLLTIAVGLYTSRVVLNTLGVSDYGVYNVVGGIVAMLSFLNSALTAASQRFISFELGRGDKQKLKTVFCTSVTIHVILAIIIFIIAETVGLWFVNTHLNIDSARMYAANWVYQCSILTFMLTIISVPYNSCIVAHEHMNAFAYVSILEVILKLLIVYLLLVINYDKLITYGILVLCVAFVIRLIYGLYCKRRFEECTYHFTFNKALFKEMFSFAGWSVVGNLGFSFKDQVANVILNIFFGTVVNAARGVALQVNGIISGFSANFIMALNPQITKQYATGNIQNSMNLVYAGCRYSFYLLALVSIPVIINMDYILELWLYKVPEYTSEFLKLALVAALINSIAQPLVTALQATGKIKVFQISICIVMLLELPLAYLILYWGGKPYMAMYPTIIVSFIGLYVRFEILRRIVPNYNLIPFIKICIRIFIVILLSYFISVKIFINERGLINLFINIISSFIITTSTIIVIGLNRNEQTNIFYKIKKHIISHE